MATLTLTGTCTSVAIAAAALCARSTTVLAPARATQEPLLVWEELGPAPLAGSSYTGRVSAIACSPTDANRYFIGGADGGVWRTVDGGASWTPLTDHMPTLSIGALALAPSDEDVVYAGTGEANYANHSRYGLGLLKSTDGGDTWELLAGDTFAGRTFSRIVVHPTDADIVYAAIARGGGFPELAAAKSHPDATGQRGVFKSTSGGASWTWLSGLPNLAATDLVMDPSNANVLYAAIGRVFGSSQNGVYKTTDGGNSWTKLSGGLPTSNLGRISLGIGTSDPNRLYVLAAGAASSTGSGASTLGAWTSSNGGTSWSSISGVGSIQSNFGWYYNVVGVKPTNAATVLMGGVSLRRSTNSGGSWSTVTPPHVDLHALEWDAAGRLVAGDDGGVHRSSNDGSSWTSLNSGLGLIQLYAGLSTHPTADETLYGGFQDNGSARRGAGLSWTQVFGGDGGWTQVDQLAPSRVFVEYQGSGNLFRSTGGSFTSSSSGIGTSDRNCFLPPYLIEVGNSDRMLYATHRVYRSTNGGTSWSAISGDLSNGAGAIRALAQSPSDPNYVYAATNDGNVLRSTNGGSAWTTVLSGHPGWPRVTNELFVHPRAPQTVFLATAAFGADQVRMSTNGGTTWTSLDGDLPDVPANVVAALPRPAPHAPLLFVGTDAGLFHSSDGGQHWRRYGKDLPNAVVIDVRLDRPRQRILVATQGRGVWRAPLIQDAGPF
jgi:photosystem II stability/assembly factor-like uncharacterized protein